MGGHLAAMVAPLPVTAASVEEPSTTVVITQFVAGAQAEGEIVPWVSQVGEVDLVGGKAGRGSESLGREREERECVTTQAEEGAFEGDLRTTTHGTIAMAFAQED